jgi:hypothetical protein
VNRLLNVLITHQAPPAVDSLLNYWLAFAEREDLLVVHGGSKSDFEALTHPHKLFVRSPRLRTTDHQRERQSYTEAFQLTAPYLMTGNFTHVYVAEYDHLPLVKDLGARLLDRLATEQADVLGHQLQRVDGTSSAHYLNHIIDPRFLAYWQSVSRRRDRSVILNMFGSGSFWTRQAFLAVAGFDEPFPMYLEIWLPTLAHHLGFRLRDYTDQNRFVRSVGDWAGQTDEACRSGAWTIHPVKSPLPIEK